MSVDRGLKITGYAHVALLFAPLTPLLYMMGGLWDPAGAGVLYGKCLLIVIPAIIIDWAAKRVKYLAVYIGICVGLLMAVWGIAAFFHASRAYAVCYCLVMSAGIIFMTFKRLQARLKESSRKKAEDPLAAKEDEFLDTPRMAFLGYFVVIYALGLCLNGKALCDMTFGSAVAYLFLALIASYFRAARGYLEINKRIKGIPTRRLYGVGFAMLLLFMAILLIGILPSFFLASHRQYVDVRGWLNDLEPPSQKYHQDMEFIDPVEEDIWDMLDEGELAPEPSVVANILFGMFTGVCMLVFVYGILLAIRRVFQDFRNSRDENGDIIEEINDKGRTDKEEMLEKRHRRTDSAA